MKCYLCGKTIKSTKFVACLEDDNGAEVFVGADCIIRIKEAGSNGLSSKPNTVKLFYDLKDRNEFLANNIGEQKMEKTIVQITSASGQQYNVYGIQPELWQAGGYTVFECDAFDKQYFGGENLCRVKTDRPIIESLAIRIHIRGNARIHYNRYGYNQIACQIEFLKDGEESDFTSGVAYIEQI